MPKVERNLSLFKWNNFFAYMWPLSAVGIIYFEQITGSWALASLIYSTYVLTQALSELPVGIISDKWSRKNTVIVSSMILFLSGVCFALAGNLSSTTLLFMGSACWGLGGAFDSGTDEALMYETCKDLCKEDEYDVVFSGAKIWRYLGATAATMIAVPTLYFSNMNMLAWVSLIPAFGSLWVSFLFTEPESHDRAKAHPLRHFMGALKNFKLNAKLRKIALAHIMNFSWGETQYRLNSVYYAQFLPIWAVDVAVFVYRGLTAAGFWAAMFIRKIGLLKMAFVSTLFKIVIVGAGLLINNVISPFLMATSSLASGGERSAESALMQKEFSDSERATMYSIVAIFGGILTAISFYVFGLLADAYSVRTSLTALLIYKIIISSCYWRLMKKYGHNDP